MLEKLFPTKTAAAPASVDEVLSSITTAIDQLAVLSADKQAEVEAADAAIEAAQRRRSAAISESNRALTVRERLSALVA